MVKIEKKKDFKLIHLLLTVMLLGLIAYTFISMASTLPEDFDAAVKTLQEADPALFWVALILIPIFLCLVLVLIMLKHALMYYPTLVAILLLSIALAKLNKVAKKGDDCYTIDKMWKKSRTSAIYFFVYAGFIAVVGSITFYLSHDLAVSAGNSFDIWYAVFTYATAVVSALAGAYILKDRKKYAQTFANADYYNEQDNNQ